MSKNEKTVMIKKMEKKEPYNLYFRTQDALAKENDNKDFLINYELAFKTISSNMDLDKIRKLINENSIETKAIRSLFDNSKELFRYFIKQNLCCMVSSLILITYDFANDVLKFSDEQLQMIRNELYPQKIVDYDMLGMGSMDALYHDMINHISRKTLMLVEDHDQTAEQKKKSNIVNKFIIQFETESITMNHINSSVLRLYDRIITTMTSVAAFGDLSLNYYPKLLKFMEEDMSGFCLELKNQYIGLLQDVMIPYANNLEYTCLIALIGNAINYGNELGCTMNVFPESSETKSIDDSLKDNYPSNFSF